MDEFAKWFTSVAQNRSFFEVFGLGCFAALMWFVAFFVRTLWPWIKAHGDECVDGWVKWMGMQADFTKSAESLMQQHNEALTKTTDLTQNIYQLTNKISEKLFGDSDSSKAKLEAIHHDIQDVKKKLIENGNKGLGGSTNNT